MWNGCYSGEDAMKVSEFIKELEKFDLDKEVIISDGFLLNFYTTDGVEFGIFEGKVDIGIGGCNEEEEV
jgi:hypothetical protein